MAFLDTLKSAWNQVTKLFNPSKEETKATPTTTTTSTQPITSTDTDTQPSTVQQQALPDNEGTVVGNPNNTSTLNDTIARQSQISNEQDVDNITNEKVNQTNYYDISGVDSKKINAVLDKREKESKEHWRETIGRLAKTGATYVSNLVIGQTADSEAQANEEKVYVGYNKDNGDMYELKLNDSGVYGAQDKFSNAYNNFLNNLSKYGDNVPNDVWLSEYDNFYNQVSGLFKAEADDRYSDGIIFQGDGATRLGRRKDNFSEEQLDTLAQNGITSTQDFVPSKEQLLIYLDVQNKNSTKVQEIKNKYKIKEDPLELDNNIQGRAQEMFLNRAMVGVLDAARDNLSGKAINNYPLRAAEITESVFGRAWDYAEPLLEEAELIKLEAQRQGRELTEEEKQGIAQADKINGMLNALSDGLNYFIKDNMSSDWVDDNGQITGVRDIFSDGRDLWGVISHPVISAAGIDADNWQALGSGNNMSWLDAFQQVANEGRYHLSNSRSGTLGRAWNSFDRGLGKVGNALSEIGQQSVGGLMQLGNIYKDTVTLDGISLMNRFMGNRSSLSQTAEYMNQDFTIGKMLTTEETGWGAKVFGQDGSRTIRKYLLQAAEYGPEMAGNIIPDILLYSTGIGELGTVGTIGKYLGQARSLGIVQKADKVLESVNLFKKARGVAEGTKAAAEAISNSAEAPSWIKVGLQYLDKGLTNGIIDQTIDAQYSGYDTESYSTPSMALSLGGTIGFEVIPWLYKSGVLRMGKNALSGKNLLDGTTWDVLNFFSDEANSDAIKRIANTRFNKSPNGLTFDDLVQLKDSFNEMKQATKEYRERLPADMKVGINKWTKQNAYNMLTQVYNLDNNSTVARGIRAMISKDGTNIADIAKYLGGIPGDVEFGPWKSTIKLKNAKGETETRIGTYGIGDTPYNASLDIAVEGGLANKLSDGFTLKDINTIKEVPGYSGINESMFTLENGKYYINEDGLKTLGIETKEMPAVWAAREINKAEASQISNKFKEVMGKLRESEKQISDGTIDLVSESQTYQDIRDKVADVVC